MRNYFTFGRTDSRDFGVYISGSGVFNSPVKAYEPLVIPGRDGDLLSKEKRLENIELVYPCFIYTNFKENIAGLRESLLSQDGYQNLSDSYHTDEIRSAYYAGGLEVEPTARLDAGNFELRFMCKPQRYLNSGWAAVTLTQNGTITNPTRFYARPTINIYGTGSVYVSGVTITVTYANTEATIINCEMMSAYDFNYVTANQFIELSGNDFPTLRPGSNTIRLSGGVTKVEIIPRWYIV